MDAYNIIIYLFLLLIVAFFLVVSKTIEYYRNKIMHQKIEQCFYDSFREFNNPYKNARHDEYMSHSAANFFDNCFCVVQHKTTMDSKYKLTTEESDIALDIIKTFQQWLLRSYLLGHYNNKRFAKLTTDHFLIERLGVFLSENELNTDFNKQEMFVIERKEDRRAVYHFTNYSRVYYKMLYISQLYCNICLKNNDSSTTPWFLENIQKNLDNDYIEVYW